MSASTHDYLIIGQGLAGSLLARELVALDRRVLVIDDHYKSSSSTVAGGLINPVTGKRLALQPGIDYLLPAAQRRYRSLEQKAGLRFFFPLPMPVSYTHLTLPTKIKWCRSRWWPGE